MTSLKKNLQFLLLVFAFIQAAYLQSTPLSTSQICQSNVSPNLMQSGSYSLTRQYQQNSRINTFQYAVTFTIPQGAPLSIVASTSRINAYNPSVGTDYSIRGSRVNNTNLVNFVLLINHDFSWSSIIVSFLATARSDFWTGYFIPDTQDFYNTGIDKITAQYTINNWISTSTRVNFIYLISGLRTSDSSFNVSLAQGGFNASTGLVSVQVKSDASPPIETIHVSFVIFLSNSPFTLIQYNPLVSQPSFSYLFEGINSYNGNSITYEGYAFNSTTIQTIPCYGSNCPSTCVTLTICSNSNGIINLNRCFICGFQEVYSNQQCVSRCPSANQTWTGSSCVCKTGYIRVNNVCRILNCEQNQFFDGIQCKCNPGYQRINNVCQLTSCSPSSFFNGIECQCNQGYVKIDKKCFFQCTPNGYVNELGLCVCMNGYVKNNKGQCFSINCQSNEIYDPIQSRCVCNSGSLYSRNQCLPKCGDFPNAIIFEGVCVCIEGYDVVNGQCVKTMSCQKQNQIMINNQCQCRSGYQYNSLGLCIPYCLVNQVLVSQSCQCINGYKRNSFSTCTPICPTNQIFINNTCQCANNFARSYSGSCVSSCLVNQYVTNKTCVCIQNYIRNSNGVCVQNATTCGQFEFLNGTACQCINGYIKQSGKCVNPCRINEIYDSTVRDCICKEGYGLTSGGLCDLCPPNSHSTGLLSGCICDTFYQWNSTLKRCQLIVCQPNSSMSSTGVCVCNLGFYLDGTECKKVVSCPPRSLWDSVKLVCVCKTSGEYLINGSCQTCQQNSVWNGSQCVCSSGFYLINGTCQQCSPNSQYLRNQCVCNFGYFGNGLTCSACHLTCGTCINSSANGCLTCANASYTLSSTQCISSVCDSGFFYNPSALRCQKCIDYCSKCNNTVTCQQCTVGFQLFQQSIFPLTINSCIETCGDGRKFYDECDDGNTVSGDGCNSLCQLEQGWTCLNGSSTSPSKCYNILPSASKIVLGGHVILQGQVLQGISLSYIPVNLTAGGCPLCSSLLNVSVISSPLIPITTITFIPTTQYKFVAKFDFFGVPGTFVFNFTIRLNPAFSSYFAQQDMQQVIVVTIDMAVLSRVDLTDNLVTGNLQSYNNPLNSSPGMNVVNQTKTPTIDGIPQQAIDLLFPK